MKKPVPKKPIALVALESKPQSSIAEKRPEIKPAQS
jgi:hypothetical protein